MKRIIAALIAIALLAGCSSGNVEDVKAHAAATWRQAGFEVIGYEGYTLGLYLGPNYSGGNVWHTVRRIPDNGVTYHGYIEKWGDEYHIYSLTAIDVIRPAQ